VRSIHAPRAAELTEEEALNHAIEEDAARVKRKRRFMRMPVQYAQPARPDWMQDRSLLPKKPPGRA
jgi:hypothetical protein